MLFPYWKENNRVVHRMLASNVTFWSEEFGEIAISYLAQTQSPSHKADIDVSNYRWLDVRLKYEARNLGLFKRKKEREKKFREVKDDDEAVTELIEYFELVISEIVDGKFVHYPEFKKTLSVEEIKG